MNLAQSAFISKPTLQ